MRGRSLGWPPVPLLIIAAGALAAWLMVGSGFANYDTAYSLLWGSDLAHGRLPDYSVPVAPTPHPLATLEGLVLAPFGDGAESASVLVAYVALGALAYVTYALAAECFGPAAGALAAVIVLTRQPVLSFGVRAYFDIPYVVLVLGALLVEVRRPRAGVPVLALLGLAGLLRPEAWLFAGVYALWLREPKLIALAAAAPAVWLGFDWAFAGDPLHSLLDTRDNAQTLQRRPGLDEVPLPGPRRLGEILREPVLLGAALGIVLLWRRSKPLLAAGLLALGAFCILAAAGLPILGRYLLLPAVLLAVICAGTVFAPERRTWAAVVTGIALLVFIPPQVGRIRDLDRALALQRDIRDDLRAVVRGGVPCEPIIVPNHRPVPLLALWLGVPPDSIVSAQLRRPQEGTFLAPANERVERNYVLDPNDPGDLSADVPDGFDRKRGNASWIVHARC